MSTLKVDTIQDTSGVVRRGLMTYAIIGDQKTSSTEGGTFTSGATSHTRSKYCIC